MSRPHHKVEQPGGQPLRARPNASLYYTVSARRAGSPLPPALLLVLTATTAHAAEFAGACQPSDSAFLCRLRSVLMLLEIAAAALALLLLVAIFAALTIYRRKARKPSPMANTHEAP